MFFYIGISGIIFIFLSFVLKYKYSSLTFIAELLLTIYSASDIQKLWPFFILNFIWCLIALVEIILKVVASKPAKL